MSDKASLYDTFPSRVGEGRQKQRGRFCPGRLGGVFLAIEGTCMASPASPALMARQAFGFKTREVIP